MRKNIKYEKDHLQGYFLMHELEGGQDENFFFNWAYLLY
jgi:hypothetical protein